VLVHSVDRRSRTLSRLVTFRTFELSFFGEMSIRRIQEGRRLDNDDFLIPISFLSDSLREGEFKIMIVIEIMPLHNSAAVADCLIGNSVP
jgi:hypothetical protein